MRRSATLVLLAVCLIGAGCGATADADAPGEQTGEVRYVDDGTFTIARADDPGSYDPYHTSGVLGLDDLAYDPLVNLRPDGEYVSGLAEEWSVDATSATFTLRPGVTCSDGTPLTATAVAEAITYVSDPANTSPLYGQQTPTVPLTATGDDTSRTVEVVLAEPFGLLLESIGTLPIVCPAGMQDPTILETGSSGTGPYELVSRGFARRFSGTIPRR